MGANERQRLAHRLVHARMVRRVVGRIAAMLCVVARRLRHADPKLLAVYGAIGT